MRECAGVTQTSTGSAPWCVPCRSRKTKQRGNLWWCEAHDPERRTMTITLTPEMREAVTKYMAARSAVEAGSDDDASCGRWISAAMRAAQLLAEAVEREGERCRTT